MKLKDRKTTRKRDNEGRGETLKEGGGLTEKLTGFGGPFFEGRERGTEFDGRARSPLNFIGDNAV